MEDFSLNLLCKGKNHLLSLTLDSLKNQRGSFEILLLCNEKDDTLHNIVKCYPGLNIRVETGTSQTPGSLMNLGLKRSLGKYIQFLEPPERYISQYGLSYLTEQIVEMPLLITSRGVSQDTKSHWFLRSKLLEMGGFDEKICFRPIFDLICRYQKWGIEPHFCSRVLVDAAIEKTHVFETSKIIYHHFGIKRAMKWFLLGQSYSFHKIANFFQQAFRQEKN